MLAQKSMKYGNLSNKYGIVLAGVFIDSFKLFNNDTIPDNEQVWK